MICLKLNLLFYDTSRMLQLSDLYGRYVLQYKSFLTIFSVRLVAINSDYFSLKAFTPFHFLRTLPFMGNSIPLFVI